MRIICGKFSRKSNHAKCQSFLPFVKYSENPCGECPRKGLPQGFLNPVSCELRHYTRQSTSKRDSGNIAREVVPGGRREVEIDTALEVFRLVVGVGRRVLEHNRGAGRLVVHGLALALLRVLYRLDRTAVSNALMHESELVIGNVMRQETDDFF